MAGSCWLRVLHMVPEHMATSRPCQFKVQRVIPSPAFECVRKCACECYETYMCMVSCPGVAPGYAQRRSDHMVSSQSSHSHVCIMRASCRACNRILQAWLQTSNSDGALTFPVTSSGPNRWPAALILPIRQMCEMHRVSR